MLLSCKPFYQIQVTQLIFFVLQWLPTLDFIMIYQNDGGLIHLGHQVDVDLFMNAKIHNNALSQFFAHCESFK